MSWQLPRKFVDVVTELRRHHLQLWFRPGDGVPLPTDHHVALWTGCELISANERILAIQTGDANQWLLSAHFCKADRYPFTEEIDGCQEITEDFFFLVTGSMFLMNLEQLSILFEGRATMADGIYIQSIRPGISIKRVRSRLTGPRQRLAQ